MVHVRLISVMQTFLEFIRKRQNNLNFLTSIKTSFSLLLSFNSMIFGDTISHRLLLSASSNLIK
uniref:Uncharacterized protein n=1 Tax=Lepeophtheirus salmonis TaxID=72036 RepID=A0A0K2T0R7_LEPSM